MLDTSFWLLIKNVLLNILLPLIPGIFFLWIFFGKKFTGWLFYLLSWFLGFAVVAFGLFNLQFIHFGIGVGEYFILLGCLVIIFLFKIIIQKASFRAYVDTLKITSPVNAIRHSYFSLSVQQKIFLFVGLIFVLYMLILTFIYRANLPSYSDDTFGNRNQVSVNVYYDGGVKIFGDKSEILGRGKLGYPIFAPIYKTEIATFAGSFDDIYINMWQWFLFLGLILFSAKIIFDKTKNIFYALLPAICICGLPLIFFHATEGYVDLACAIFAVMSIWGFWKFLDAYDGDYLSLAFLFGFILANIKNDGTIVYFPGILIGFVLILLLRKQFISVVKAFVRDRKNLWYSIGSFAFFFLPFLLVKMYHGLGFNQAAGVESGAALSSSVHWEIFRQFPLIFTGSDNYNIILVLIALMIFFFFKNKKKNDLGSAFLLITPIVIFVIFLLVFLLTENYKFALDQTTINRVFTMSFVIFLAFSPLFALSSGKE